jgi:trehalose 6-phosphate phosphatase
MKAVYDALKELSSGNCVIALDRDGTLVPYADRPEEAQVTPELREVLHKLAAEPGVYVAIVSARSVAQLRADFDSSKIILAGNYGVEVMLPDGRFLVQPQAVDAVPSLKAVRDDLFTRIDRRCGAILEDHGYSLCLHWHRVPLSQREQLHDAVRQVADLYPSVRFRTLPTSYEVLPDFAWDKGMALASIDSYLETDASFFFAGDSHADTPAFRWIDEHDGVSVRVGLPERLGAQFTVPEPAALHGLLAYLKTCRAGA